MSASIAVALRQTIEQLDQLTKAFEALAARVSTMEQAPTPRLSLKPSPSSAKAGSGNGD